MSSNGNGKIQFGDFSLDPGKRVVWHRDQPVDLPLKAVDLLCLLVERRGDVVTKDEIWKSVWNDAFIEETNLTHNIYLLRKTFREYGANDVIKTVPRRGYRFSADIDDTLDQSIIYERMTVTDTVIEESAVRVTESRTVTATRKRVYAAVAVAVLAFVSAGLAVWSTGGFSTTNSRIDSMAVLPFRVLSVERDHSGIGIADTLITRLSAIKGLNVRPTSAVAALPDFAAVEAGKTLDVDAILEGTIYRTGDQVRITARLVKTVDESVIWSGEFQKPIQDEISAQNELAAHIVDALAVNLNEVERSNILRSYTGNAEAYRLYEKGRFEWSKRNYAAMTEAQRLFRNAIEKDPNFALAYSGLADTLATGSNWTEAADAATRALQIDPNLAEAHATDGFIKMFGHWHWDGAEKSFQRSIELNPGYAAAHHWYATLLAIRGRSEEAKAEMRRAIEINPVSFNYIADLGQLYYFAGDYRTAEIYCHRALEINRDFAFAHQYLFYIRLKTGEHGDAIEEIIKTDRLNSTATNYEGKREAGEKHLDRYRQVFRENGLRGYLDLRYNGKPIEPEAFYFFAIKHALLGENEKAIDYLERASEARTFLTAFVKAEPIFEGLRGDRRFQNILKQMSLAD